MSGYQCNALSIVSTEESTESSSFPPFKVIHWCSNTLDCSWNNMSEFVWMGNGADSIYMYVVEEYVMRSCRYTCVKSYHKVVPHVYIGLYS